MSEDRSDPAPGRGQQKPAGEGGSLERWPSDRYYELVAEMAAYVGHPVYISVAAFTGGFVKQGQPYRLLDLAPFPSPQDHPFPAKRAYPHMLVLESIPPQDGQDAYWRSGTYHGGAVNLAHVGSITTAAYPERADQFLYANLGLLAWYYGKPARQLLEEGLVPERVAASSERLPERGRSPT